MVRPERSEGRQQVNGAEITPRALTVSLSAWSLRSGPLYLRLADAIGDAIAQGAVSAGVRLPPERSLAAHLAVGRGTVTAAYDALRARRAVSTRRGSGTYVNHPTGPGSPHRSALLSNLLDARTAPIDLSLGALQSTNGLPDTAFSLLDAARSAPAHGYAPLGLPALREAIAERLCSEGVSTSADEVLVTGGGQGAISLLAATLIRPGDRVLVEAPCYPAAIEVFARSQAQLEGVSRDHAGPLPDMLEQALAGPPVRVIYLTPTCHNPTGSVMSEQRRREVLRLAATAGTMVIEDAVLAPLLFDGDPPPALAAIEPDRVCMVGSLSKTIWGGLRVGWIRAPTGLVQRLGRAKAAYDLGSAVLTQIAALDCLARYDQLLAERRALVRRQLQALVVAVRELLPDWAFTEPMGGLSVWAALPHGSADDLAQLAVRRGVLITPGSTAAVDDAFLGHVRLSAGPPPPTLREGIERLARAWATIGELPAGAATEPPITV
jgi:DNA-binding transcriptional MocR family regulator